MSIIIQQRLDSSLKLSGCMLLKRPARLVNHTDIVQVLQERYSLAPAESMHVKVLMHTCCANKKKYFPTIHMNPLVYYVNVLLHYFNTIDNCMNLL